MSTTITPAATRHAVVHVPQNSVDLADAAWMTLYTWRELADNAEYAYQQIDVKIAALKADNALTFSGTVVTFLHGVQVDGNLVVSSIVPPSGPLMLNQSFHLLGSGRTISGGRVLSRVVTLDAESWSGSGEQYHSITTGNVVRVTTSVAAVLRLLTAGCSEGDSVRVTLVDGGTVAVHNGAAETALATLSDDGQQMWFVYDATAEAWVVG